MDEHKHLTIQYASDLHLEFRENSHFMETHPLLPAGDILVLAGDIVPFAIMNKHKDFFNYLSGNFKMTYWLPGNHEYYHYDVAAKCGTIYEKIRSNVYLVNNIAIEHQNTRLLFSTLWSKINPVNQWEIEEGMNDFHVIKYNGYPFSFEKFNQLHEQSMVFIKQALAQKHTGKTVMVTHHVPTLLNYPAMYKTSILNEAFAIELFDLIEPSGIHYWIYGHHHYNTPDFNIGNTRMLTNQLGYVKTRENVIFDNGKTISV